MIIGKCPVCGEDMRIGSDMTNADRIRSMTDEELAEYLAKKQYEAKTTGAWSADVWLEILKEEVNEE